MSSIYTVRPGDTITDVVLNATGTLVNWDAILEANGFTDWTPQLSAGQLIIIPDTVQLDQNALRQLKVYPLSNFSVSGIAAQIKGIFDLLGNNWILETGLWNGNAVWTANGVWKDPA